MLTTRTALFLLTASLVGCGATPIATTGPAKVDIPAWDGVAKKKVGGPPKRQSPPLSGSSKEAPFPAIAKSKLTNGLGVDVVTVKTLPIVQIRVLVRAGANYGSLPGVGEITASMLKDGGTRSMASAELLRRVETLGADLKIHSETDATVVSLALTKDKVSEGLGLLSQVVREPRFDADELKKLKARQTDEIQDRLKSSGAWAATWLGWSEQYPDKHPYKVLGALPSQIAKIDGNAVREFHRKFYVPKNTTLVLAGDIDEATAKELAQKNFGSWTGGEPPKVDFAAPKPIDKTRVLLAHRAKSVQSDVLVAMFAPERKSDKWAQVRVTNQILGGGVASRLFSDVREQRSLAYSTRAGITELAHGEQPLSLYAGTESSKTALAVTGLVENLSKMKSSPPTPQETDTASRYLSDIFAIRMETVGSIADMIVIQEAFGLPDNYYDEYRKQVRATKAAEVGATAAKLYSDKYLILVSGDADVIGNDLARFGEVTVFDPEHEFKTMKTIPAAGAK